MAASLLSLGFKAHLAAAAAASFRSDVDARFFAFNSTPRVREPVLISLCCGLNVWFQTVAEPEALRSSFLPSRQTVFLDLSLLSA